MIIIIKLYQIQWKYPEKVICIIASKTNKFEDVVDRLWGNIWIKTKFNVPIVSLHWERTHQQDKEWPYNNIDFRFKIELQPQHSSTVEWYEISGWETSIPLFWNLKLVEQRILQASATRQEKKTWYHVSPIWLERILRTLSNICHGSKS